jgi:hypothetical protein
MSLDNKISNIIGTKLPQWVIKQLNTRSVQNSRDVRDNNNVIYLGNKSAWVRLVSSIDINGSDLNYFKTTVGIETLTNASDLAKQYVLFGGTSIYLDNKYQLRSGISDITSNQLKNGAYGILGKDEIARYGYRPMPGITSVTIETQGRLGSIRSATINFKVWDKAQLDIIDALYFKLGYTMFLEWGHTYYYPSPQNPNSTTNINLDKVQQTELLSINPFAQNLTKENILRQISKSSRESEGNYDAMLGMVTNFNFVYNQEGGYDCTLRLMSLGVLGDSIKINNPSILPNLLKDEIIKLSETLQVSSTEGLGGEGEGNLNVDPNDPNSTIFSIYAYLNKLETQDTAPAGSERRLLNFRGLFDPSAREIIEEQNVEYINIISKYAVLNSLYAEPRAASVGTLADFQLNNKFNYDFIYDDFKYSGPTLYLQKFGLRIPEKNPENWVRSATLDKERMSDFITQAYTKFLSEQKQFLTVTDYLLQLKSGADDPSSTGFFDFITNNTNKNNPQVYISKPIVYEVGSKDGAFVDFNSVTQRNETIYPNQKKFYLKIKITLPNEIFSFERTKILNGKTIQDFSQLGNSIFESILFKLHIKDTDLNLTGTPRVNKINIKNVRGFDPFYFSVSGVYEFPITEVVEVANPATNDKTRVQQEKKYPITWEIFTTDTSLIKEITPALGLAKEQLFSDFYKTKQQRELELQNQIEIETQEAQKLAQQELSNQILEALSFQSALEITLRTIQVRALNRAYYRISKDKPDLEIGRRVYEFEMTDRKNFISQIFSNGVYSDIIENLIYNPDSIKISDYDISDELQFAVNAKYGFVTSLLGNKADFEDLNNKEVNYKDLLKAYVVPYKIDTELIAGVKTNHPVYIPFGVLLMLLNHTCTIYDTKKGTGKSFQKPLVYLDYNPNTNFMLTNAQQLSTNPWVTLIPYEGGFNDYKSLFDNDVIKGTSIIPVSGSQQTTPLFNPENQDLLSGQLPKIKDTLIYRGKVMNILLNIDYLSNLVRDYSFRDGSNNVYLKPFLEQILSDINKYLGNFNALRLSYNDSANTFQIVDDQLVPALSNEVQIPSNPINNNIENRTELPLLGLSSIAKSLEIKTEISSKLSSMLAISANSNPSEQAQLSTNGDPFGFINVNYTDRYIPRRLAVSNTGSAVKNGEIVASTQFNQTISDFYSKINPSYADVSQATSFYIEKMSKIKNNDSASRASVLIPVSVNLTTDGLSGLNMGQAFTIPQELLPYTYTSKKPGTSIDNYVNQVGFAIVGLTHTIEGNSWNTAIKAQMLPVKDITVFSRRAETINRNDAQFGQAQSILSSNSISYIKGKAWSAMFISYVMNQATNGAFPIDANHNNYINKIKTNPNGFLLLNPKFSSPILGDIVIYNRPGGQNTFDTVTYDGPAHGDIVVDKIANQLITIGGNVSETVRQTIYNLNNQGRITNQNVFMIVRPPQNFVQKIVSATKVQYNLWSQGKITETNILALPLLRPYYDVVGLIIPT